MRAEPYPIPLPRSRTLGAKSLIRISVTAAIAFVLAAIATQFMPRYYRAEAKILPTSGSGPSSALLDLAANTGVADLFGGRAVMTENPAFTYPEILQSGLLLERALQLPFRPSGGPEQTVIDALGIQAGSQRDLIYKGVKRLRKVTSVSANPRSGLITIGVVTRDSVLSAVLANGMLTELNRFNLESRSSRGRASRVFIEGRLAEAKAELARAEGNLTAFRASNIRIGSSPQLLLEQGRLEREVDMQADVYRLLAKQHEMARIEEQRDTPTFSVIDPAKPPVRKYLPSTLLNASVAACLVLVLLLMLEYFNLLRSRSPGYSRPGAENPR